jgi:hypothetical protein
VLVTDAFHESALQAGFAVARAQLARLAVEAQPRAVQHRDRRAQLFDVGEHVRGEEERPTLAGQPPEHRFHRDARGRVKPAHRLVEHVQFGLGEEARGEAELLRHDLRQHAHRPRERSRVQH